MAKERRLWYLRWYRRAEDRNLVTWSRSALATEYVAQRLRSCVTRTQSGTRTALGLFIVKTVPAQWILPAGLHARVDDHAVPAAIGALPTRSRRRENRLQAAVC
jgi:hypothetical protein